MRVRGRRRGVGSVTACAPGHGPPGNPGRSGGRQAGWGSVGRASETGATTAERSSWRRPSIIDWSSPEGADQRAVGVQDAGGDPRGDGGVRGGEREAAEGAAEAVAGLEELVEEELAAARPAVGGDAHGAAPSRVASPAPVLLLLVVLFEELAGHLGQGERVDGPVDESASAPDQRPSHCPGSGRG